MDVPELDAGADLARIHDRTAAEVQLPGSSVWNSLPKSAI